MKLQTNIGNFKPENRIFLAPIAEVNDIAFRLLCKKQGAGLTYTGMINPLTQKQLDLDDCPAIQLFCTNEEGIAEFIKKYQDKVSLFDFNLGCPAKTARKLGFGAFLHNKLEIIEKILKTMRQSTQKPITIKLRKSKYTMKIIKIAEKYCDAICIHPRTEQQGYSGTPDMDFALRLKKRTKLPVIYSGDVNENNALCLLKQFDFIMIARSALGNPNIFAEINKKLSDDKNNASQNYKNNKLINNSLKNKYSSQSDTLEHTIMDKIASRVSNINKSKSSENKITFTDYLNLAQKYNLKFSQIKMQAMYFTLGKNNAKDLRRKLVKAKTINEIKEIMN